MIEEDNKIYIPPDYSQEEVNYDSDFDDDDDDPADYEFPDDDENDVEEEELSKQQEQLNEKQMSVQSPFGQTPQWGTPSQQTTPWGTSNPSGQQTFPWQTQRPAAPVTPQYSWQFPGQQQQPAGPNVQGPTQAIRIDRPKQIVIIDVFDGLIESLASEGQPNIPPRAVYDIKLKFDVWNALRSFSPQVVYAIFPALTTDAEGKKAWQAAIKYLTYSLSSYLQIPEYNCIIIKQMVFGQPKEVIIKAIADKLNDKKAAVYVGVNSGYWGLGNGDLLAAKHCQIDYADIFQLTKGEI
jgi:hypothetical protein